MEVIKSISDIKSVKLFPDSKVHRQYLLQKYIDFINKLSKIADEVTEYQKIKTELLKQINEYSEDDTNSEIIINNVVGAGDTSVEADEEEPNTEEKPKAKKITKKADIVTVTTEEPVTKVKKTTKKIDIVDIAVATEEQVTEEKPKAKKTTKKAEIVSATAEEPVAEEKPKAKKITKKAETVSE